MKGFDRRGGVPIGYKAINTPLHLLRGTVGECQRKDLLGECALFCYQPSDTPCDHLRLPCASASNHKEWALTVRDRRILLIIQIAEKTRNAIMEGAWCAD